VISSGEQLPEGESVASRLFVIDVEKGDVNITDLRDAQKKAVFYKYAMSHYILWLRDNWDSLKKNVPEAWEIYRDKALAEGGHLRLPAAVAWLYTGLEQGLSYAIEIGAISVAHTEEILDRSWETFIKLSARQGARVDTQRPASRFLEALDTLLTQRKVVVTLREYNEPTELKQGQLFIGWQDDTWYYLIPTAVYGAIYEFYNRGGFPLTFKPPAIWSDLHRLGYIEGDAERHQTTTWIGQGESGETKRVIKLKQSAVHVFRKGKDKGKGSKKLWLDGENGENEAI
jgi:hypothetical protein